MRRPMQVLVIAALLGASSVARGQAATQREIAGR